MSSAAYSTQYPKTMVEAIRCIRCGEEIMEDQDYWHTPGGPKHERRDGCRRAREESTRESPDSYSNVELT